MDATHLKSWPSMKPLTIKFIAECVYDAVKKRVSTQKCIISNTETDAGTGLHWFTVLFDIDADPK